MRPTLTVGSLFSGIGGFELGLERTGHFRTLWQCEIDPWARAVLTKHWPEVPKFDDIRSLDPTTLPWVDLVCGGFPCQPHSSASRGRKSGTRDPRWLWPEMHRVIDGLRPAWVVAENVSQLDGPALDQVVSDLAASDYEVGVLEIPACAFGHDHWRPRLWICGHTDRHGEPGGALDAALARVSRPGGDANRMGAPHGLPGRLDRRRLAGLGNAIVPQIATFLGSLIVAAETIRHERTA